MSWPLAAPMGVPLSAAPVEKEEELLDGLADFMMHGTGEEFSTGLTFLPSRHGQIEHLENSEDEDWEIIHYSSALSAAADTPGSSFPTKTVDSPNAFSKHSLTSV